jgi:hypothetical protein
MKQGANAGEHLRDSVLDRAGCGGRGGKMRSSYFASETRELGAQEIGIAANINHGEK